MRASLKHEAVGLAIEDLFSESLGKRVQPDPQGYRSSTAVDQGFHEIEGNQDHPEGMDCHEPSLAPDTEQEEPPQEDLIGFYFQEISRFPMLAPQRELELARTIKEGQEALVNLILDQAALGDSFADSVKKVRKWRGEVGFYPGLREKMTAHTVSILERAAAQEGASEECKRLLKEARDIAARINAARNEMAEGNLRLVLSIAKRYRGRGLSFLDLIQEGNMGLLKAISRYDYSKGNRFSTYATWWVRQSIIRAIYDKTRTIRLPVHFIEMKSHYSKTRRQLEKELGRDPTPAEVASRSGLSMDKVMMVIQLSTSSVHLEAQVGNDEQRVGDFLANDKAVSALDLVSEQELVKMTRMALASLSPREEAILKSRFGIDGNPTQTLKAIGQRFHVSKERVRQIEKTAIRKLRKTSQRDELRCFME